MNTSTSFTTSENKKISDNIRKHMQRFGTSVTKIAEVIDQDKSTASRKLNNAKGWNWTGDDLANIAALYEIDKSELLQGIRRKINF